MLDMATAPCPDVLRFWAKVQPAGDCWIWQGYIMPNGYGQFGAGRRHVYAHRFAYEQWCGPIPQGLQIDHLCRVRNCVRPQHLEPVTCRENLLRGTGNITKTHCPKGHPYNFENTHWFRGKRYCISCRNPTGQSVNVRKTHCPHGHAYDGVNTYWNRKRRYCRTCAKAKYLRTRGNA